MFRAKVTSKGQVTIPVELREQMGLEPGDYLCIQESKEGYLIKKEVREDIFDKYVGYLKRPGNSDKLIKELRGE
jgi:AbrB family looped-hinge helix DNA binding protein